MTEIFLGREALGDGMRRHELRRWYRPVFRGVYSPKNAVLTLRERIWAAWLTTDRRGVIAGLAASAWHGAEWVDDVANIEVLVHDRRRQRGLIVRDDRLGDDEIMVVDGLPVTTPARTAFDLARYRHRFDALGRLDALMRVAPFAAADVDGLMHRYGPVRGVRQLRDLLPLVDAGAESLKESWLRLLLIDNGFPIPQTQVPVCDDGIPFAFLDMGWRDLEVAVEYDGDHHRIDRPSYVRDLRRLPRVARHGWEVVRVIKEDKPAEVLRRVYELHRRRGGAEIDGLAHLSRTFAPFREFGRNPDEVGRNPDEVGRNRNRNPDRAA
ncbi:MAG: type IV toxin-antitoxin system AbiEi family antitoxin [Mycobacterium sp.]